LGGRIHELRVGIFLAVEDVKAGVGVGRKTIEKSGRPPEGPGTGNVAWRLASAREGGWEAP
jgi:hypothetical protein